MDAKIQRLKEKVEMVEKKEKGKNEQLEMKIIELRGRMEKNEETVQSQITSVQDEIPTAVRDVPQVLLCGYTNAFGIHIGGIIRYYSIFSEFHTPGEEGVMDTTSGLFTVGTPGY